MVVTKNSKPLQTHKENLQLLKIIQKLIDQKLEKREDLKEKNPNSKGVPNRVHPNPRDIKI